MWKPALTVILLSLLQSVSGQALAGYDVPVVLPACDFTISRPADWKQVNNPRYRVFCVTPAQYGYRDIGIVDLKYPGTQKQPRYLRWYDPDSPDDVSTHPARMPGSRQAVIPQLRIRASHWVIDRIVVRGSRVQSTLENGATGNVLNRLVFEGGTTHLLLQFTDSSDNVLQHSVLRNTVAVPGRDSYAIYFHKSTGERIVDNEIYNYGGGIQQSPLSGSNHVVYGNEMYITDDLYTDCSGRRDRQGSCMCSEGMAVVLKGVNRPGTSFLIENNIIYGHRRHDDFCMGSGTPGVALNLGSGGNDTRDVVIRGNLLLNRVPNNIYTGLHVGDLTIESNVVALSEHGIVNLYGENVSITGNRFADNGKDYHTGPKASGVVYRDNRKLSPAERDAMCFPARKFTAPGTVCLSDL